MSDKAPQVRMSFYDSITMGMGIYVGLSLAGMVIVIVLGLMFLCLAALFPALLVGLSV